MDTQRVSYNYDVAFSFLGQDEPLATELNDLLQDRVKTFLYSKKQGEIAGTDGEQTFNSVFGQQARIVVVLYRTGWGQTPWTRIEETAIRNRAYEHGHDFVIFIPLDDKPSVPKWLPKFRLWIGLKRWGVTGAASVIESRVQEQGGEPHEETVQERAARLQRALNFDRRRKNILGSETGVKAAKQEFETLYLELEKKIAEIKDTIEFSLKRSGNNVAILSVGLGIGVDWVYPYFNTLDDSKLFVATYNGHPPFPGVYLIREAQLLSSLQFSFDLTQSEEYVWRAETSEARTHRSEELAQFILNRFMDEVQRNKHPS